MANLVTGISIVAGWNPRIKESPAEVFIYTKITPKPAVKVSLLHLQSLVAKTTLLRVIPLLPDGSSPHESPGTRALGIPVVAGGNRTTPQIPARQGGSGSALDGVRSISSSDIAKYTPSDNNEDIEAAEELGVVEITSDQNSLLTPKISPRNRERTLISGGIDGSAIVRAPSDDDDTFYTPFRFSPSDIISFTDFGQRSNRLSDESLGISCFQDSDGCFEAVEFSGWREVIANSNDSWGPFGPKSKKFGSISSIQGGLSLMLEKKLKSIVELDALIASMDTGGQDRVAGSLGAVLRSSGLVAKMVCSTEGNDDVIAAEGEVAKQGSLKKGGFGPTEIRCDETTMVIEKDTLFVCFPDKIRDDAVVVEIMLEINPLYLEGKPYATFILAGLPPCDNGAYINFRIEDEDTWKFHTFPDFTTIDTGGIEESRLRGILSLTGKLHPVHLGRSVIIRALRCPIVLEVLGFKMKSSIAANFSWSPLDERIVVEFEIKLFFLDVKSDGDARHSIMDLFLINGPGGEDDLNVDSPGGFPTDFALEDLGFENYEIGARCYKRLRVERLMKDTDQPLRIRFSKQLAPVAQEITVPVIFASEEATLIEESVTIASAKLPLEVVFSPNSTSWKRSPLKSRVNLSKRFIRTGVNTREANPSIFISCLQPVVSPTAEAMSLALLKGCGLVERIDYSIEGSESFDDRGISIVSVKMAFELDIPSGAESMGEIVRIHTGSFRFQFATINGRLTEKGVLFEDEDELVVLSYGVFDSNHGNDKLLVNIEWSGEQGLELSCGEVMEFRLPRVTAKVVGRAVFQCANQRARVLSRTQYPSSSVISGFTKGKVIILGMDTNKSEIFLQVPCGGDGKGIPGEKIKSSGHYSLCSADPKKFSGSITSSFHSPLSEDFGGFLQQSQQHPENPAQDTNWRGPDAPYHWMWEIKGTLVLFIITIGLLCFNLVLQSTQNSALRASLRQTTIMLEEKEKPANQEFFLSNPPYFQLQKKLGGYSEDLWWSVVGLEGTQDTSRLKTDFPATGNQNTGSKAYGAIDTTGGQKGFTAAGVNVERVGESHLDEENQAKVVESKKKGETLDGLKGWVGLDGLEHQNKVAQPLQKSFAEKTQSIVLNILGFFWYLVFGI